MESRSVTSKLFAMQEPQIVSGWIHDHDASQLQEIALEIEGGASASSHGQHRLVSLLVEQTKAILDAPFLESQAGKGLKPRVNVQLPMEEFVEHEFLVPQLLAANGH